MNNCKSGLGSLRRLDETSYVSLAVTGIIMVFSVVALTPAPTLANERNRERPNRQQVLEQLSVRLNLSEQQKAAVTSIIDQEAAKRRDLMDKLRVEMDRIDRETADRLAEVLGAEQMARYNKMLEERRSRGAERQLPPPNQEATPPRPPRE